MTAPSNPVAPATDASQPGWDLPELAPARILNEFTYCPRLAYLEWVHGEFEHSADTLDGAYKHRRVTRSSHTTLDHDTPTPDDLRLRSVHLSAPNLGLVAVIDVLESTAEGDALVPVDYKRGRIPNIPERVWEPERVQVCAQGLVLRENGIYYVESHTRVTVPLDDALCDRTRQLLLDLRKMAATGHIPPPLVDSPKCPRCSLVGICLPDETHLLGSDNTSTTVTPVRPLVARRHETRPLYVQEQGARIGLSGDELQVKQGWGKKPDVVATARLPDLSHVAVFGNVQISTQAINRLMREQIPIAYFSYGGWFSGLTTGLPSKNIDLRRCQFSRAEDTKLCLSLARSIVRGKIENQRTLLRRNHPDPPAGALADLKDATESAMRATSLAELLGVEGNAARVYFAHFQSMLKPHTEGHGNPPFVFDFERRTRRPPADPVNALLSYVYSLLVRDLTIICWIVGFDPYLGYFHQPRYGRPALALDLMEEFRPIVGDSVVITLINNGEVSAGHFLQRSAAVTLTGDGRKKVLRAYERRMETEITHPLFGYKVTYRRAFEVQTRILGRVLLGEIAQYPPLTTR